MHQFDKILQLFSPGASLSFERKENQDTFILSALISSASPPDTDQLCQYLAGIPARDSVELTFSGDIPENITLREMSKDACMAFAAQVEQALKVDSVLFGSGENDFTVSLTVTKGRDGKRVLSLYSLDTFTAFLGELTVVDRFAVFRNLLAAGGICLHCQDSSDVFGTATIQATSSERFCAVKDIGRVELIGKRDEICHFRNGAEYQFVPDDFYMLNRSRSETFNSIMDSLCFIVSVVYLADISDIEKNTLSLRLNGYKVIAEKIDFSVQRGNCMDEVYRLYDWAYSGGNISDKIGIIRNLISLYAKKSVLNVEEGVYSAARSNYEIYLKENIGRYLEIKHNITNKILEMSQSCNKQIETFGSYFKQSIFAISSFFITVVVLAAIDKEKYGKVFSNDVQHISLGLIAISFVHMIFTIIEYRTKCSRFTKEYNYLKETYKDVLDDKDIVHIFDADKAYNEDYAFLQLELKKYALYWVIILIILLIIVLTVPATDTPYDYFGKVMAKLLSLIGF